MKTSVLDEADEPNSFGLFDFEIKTAVVCACGHQLIPAHAGRIIWYWQEHGRDRCTLELPDLTCWCGLRRSEHIKGHKRENIPERNEIP